MVLRYPAIFLRVCQVDLSITFATVTGLSRNARKRDTATTTAVMGTVPVVSQMANLFEEAVNFTSDFRDIS